MALKIAAIQMACSKNTEDNIKKADRLVRDAADKGARIILLPELFETLYFCQEKKYEFYELASTLEENRAVGHFQDVARELEVVLPISFFEKTPTAFFNTVAMIDADGKILGKYRKSHIPDAPGYHEKFYFTPGDTGFQVWTTRYARIGALICWDQYFGEAARIL
ncbi:MAG: N-carbamoylputrescine amidase, partial [Proteobacteria bacterium]|nr:N-carbamoylputrescine amidase [Pseudomonadota bacterium]